MNAFSLHSQHRTKQRRLGRILVLLLILVGASIPAQRASAQEPTPTPTATVSPTNTLSPTATETAIILPTTTTKPDEVVQSTERPLVVIKSYYLDKDTIKPGDTFALFLAVKNEGGEHAHNLIFSFSGEDFLPQQTGGVVAVGSLQADERKDISQPLIASPAIWGKSNGTVSVTLNYTSPSGVAYTEAFTITLAVLGWSGNSSTATPTPTGTSLPRPQIVVSSYAADLDPLEPGSIFNLNLEMRNLGSGEARDVTMVLGGSTSSGGGVEGTPQPSGISGGGSDLSVFAPLGSSNLEYLGNIVPGAVLTSTHQLIVNVSANPGAYTLKISFVYTDAKGNRLIDDQIITLLVYSLPRVEVNFYRDPGMISAMQPNTLPIQVVNLGRKSAVMGNMTVTAENAELMNNVSLVGTLDMGGYFPLDVMFIPSAPGPAEINVTINYTDDFNKARSIVQTLKVDVMEAPQEMPGAEIGPDGLPIQPGMDSGNGGMPAGAGGEETFWQKVTRFFKGLFGLDSSPQQPGQQMDPGQISPEVPLQGPKISPGVG